MEEGVIQVGFVAQGVGAAEHGVVGEVLEAPHAGEVAEGGGESGGEEGGVGGGGEDGDAAGVAEVLVNHGVYLRLLSFNRLPHGVDDAVRLIAGGVRLELNIEAGVGGGVAAVLAEVEGWGGEEVVGGHGGQFSREAKRSVVGWWGRRPRGENPVGCGECGGTGNGRRFLTSVERSAAPRG